MAITSIFARPVFLSTLSLRRATDREFMTIESSKISIHALLAESDERRGQRRPCGISISIHALLAESDAWAWCWPTITAKFLSTLSLRRATWYLCMYVHNLAHISIHALLAESDSAPAGKRAGRYYFYPRSPCGERLVITPTPWALQTFLSTLSLRRATQAAEALDGLRENFYPRSPCGERLRRCTGFQSPTGISIHALLAESDRQYTLYGCL